MRLHRLRRPPDPGAPAPPPASPLSAAQVARFQEDGFLVLPGFVDAREVQLTNDAVERAWRDRTIYNNLVVSAFTSTPRYAEIYMRNASPEVRAQPHKVNHLHLYDCGVLELLLGPKIEGVVRQLLDGSPLLFNTLNLEWGSEQRFHFDTFYMAPAVPNKMVVVWIALEDVHPDAGPLRYYPGSHLVEPYRFAGGSLHPTNEAEELPAFDEYIDKELEQRGLAPRAFTGVAGDVFIWHAQLYHGGSPIEDRTRTRRSMVAHYWRAEDYPDEMRMPLSGGRAILSPRHVWVDPAFRERL